MEEKKLIGDITYYVIRAFNFLLKKLELFKPSHV